MNITYLLGAGASAEALPTYGNFEERIKSFWRFFDDTNLNNLNPENRKLAREIFAQIETFSNEFTYHSTPDKIAKKYFHTNDETINRLKQIVILFFLFEQIFISKFDDKQNVVERRCDDLILRILETTKSTKIQNQFSILNWNYDLQFELAFLKYYHSDLANVQTFVQSLPRIDNSSIDFKCNEFSIIHLNGIAYAKPQFNFSDCLGKPHSNKDSMLEYLIETWKSLNIYGNINFAEKLMFAWENINENGLLNKNQIIKDTLAVARKTEGLVIIGYSFPDFNRLIDKEILNSMKNLKTIYIQSPQANEIRKILHSDLIKNKVWKIRIENVGNWNQYYIPSGWNLPYKDDWNMTKRR